MCVYFFDKMTSYTSLQRATFTLLKILGLALIPLIVFSILRWPLVKSIALDTFPGLNPHRHIYDHADLIPKNDVKRFEEYLRWIYAESDIDIRFVFLKNIGAKTIEEVAVETVDQLRIGGKTREERGLLLLYNIAGEELRVEVGYGLEEYFPDVFVGYLVHHHTRDFISSGKFSLGFRLLLRILHHRIREAVLGTTFDPRVIDKIGPKGHLSGGAGVSKKVSRPPGKPKKFISNLSDTERRHYIPQETPNAAYIRYLEWLIAGTFDPNIDLFTRQSQKYMLGFPVTRAYFHYMLMLEYGKNYEIAIQDNYAMLYFVDSPLSTPHFFMKTKEGWRMDIIAEVRNCRNRVGGVYVWDYSGQKDAYTKAFVDKFINIKGYIRIKDGDNRQLPTRKQSNSAVGEFFSK